MHQTHTHQDHVNCVFEMKSGDLRNQFAAKVFGTVFFQLAGTALLISLTYTSPFLQSLALNLNWLWALTTLGCLLALTLSRELAKNVPTNYIILSLFTFASAMTTFNSIYFVDIGSVYYSILFTALLVGGLAVYSFNTNTDFTSPAFNLKFLGLQLIFSLVLMFLPISNVLAVVASGLIFSTYLVIDLQLIAGRRDVKLGIDDYIMGAIIIYTDVIRLFIAIAELMNSDEKNRKKGRNSQR
jgi:hypothetical protein